MRRDSGFTLVELMIAGLLSALVVFGGFVALSSVQRSSQRQTAADGLVSGGRLAMELMARDIRSAGDSLDLLPTPCLGTVAHANRNFQCPAILEPHPWRVVIARNAWGVGPDGIRGTTDDVPDVTTAFDRKPENVVAYEFQYDSVYHPTGTIKTFTDGRKGWLGRIVRIDNPFLFPGGEGTPTTTVLLENVLLDDRMREGPNGEVDRRYGLALFLYQLLTSSNELVGDLSTRATTAGDAFLTPPLRLFTTATPLAFRTDPPYMPDYPSARLEIVGLDDTPASSTSSRTGLMRSSSQGMVASTKTSDLRLILDRNRIRTVRIAFKVVGHEQVGLTTGIDLDDNPATGLAPVFGFETTAEIKPLAHFLTP